MHLLDNAVIDEMFDLLNFVIGFLQFGITAHLRFFQLLHFGFQEGVLGSRDDRPQQAFVVFFIQWDDMIVHVIQQRPRFGDFVQSVPFVPGNDNAGRILKNAPES